jgi:hypothetical protein
MIALRRALAGALLLCVASTALADTLASAELASVKLTLVDLDPSDGITPWIQFHESNLFNRGMLYIKVNDEPVEGSLSGVLLTRAFEPFSGQVLVSTAGVSASFTVDATGLGGTQLAESHAVFNEKSQYTIATITGALNPFTLSARTSLVVTATGSAFAEVTHRWSGPDPLAEEFALVSNRIEFWDGTGDSPVTMLSQASQLVEVRSGSVRNDVSGGFDRAPSSKREIKTLSASFSNSSGTEKSAWLLTSSLAHSITPAVPEPNTAWLLLLGLMGAGRAVRFRSRGEKPMLPAGGRLKH